MWLTLIGGLYYLYEEGRTPGTFYENMLKNEIWLLPERKNVFQQASLHNFFLLKDGYGTDDKPFEEGNEPNDLPLTFQYI